MNFNVLKDTVQLKGASINISTKLPLEGSMMLWKQLFCCHFLGVSFLIFILHSNQPQQWHQVPVTVELSWRVQSARTEIYVTKNTYLNPRIGSIYALSDSGFIVPTDFASAFMSELCIINTFTRDVELTKEKNTFKRKHLQLFSTSAFEWCDCCGAFSDGHYSSHCLDLMPKLFVMKPQNKPHFLTENYF